MNPLVIGFLRGLGLAVLVAVLAFISDASHLAFLGNPLFETLIASAALALEHKFEDNTGKALFGAIKKR